MREDLPYRLLMVLAVAIGGLAVLYNTVFRESFATTLRYEYPAVESAAPQADAAPATERSPGAEPAAGIGTDTAPEQSAVVSVQFPLDLNAATEEELKFIPRVGEVMARRIVQYREELGGYTDLLQLREIKGVGDSTYELLWSYLYITAAAGEPASPEETTADE